MNSSKSNSHTKGKIIWALDPTHDPALAKNLVQEMKVWAKHLNCSIQPVTVFSHGILNFPFELTYPSKEEFTEIAQATLDRYLRKAKLKDILPPKKIITSSNSTRKMAAELAKYADKEKALLIFTNTRARKTLNPFRLGGFAETLVATSRTPVLLMNPDAKPSAKIPSILFATDFGQDSKAALMNLSPWAKAFGSEVILYSQIENPAIAAAEFSGSWPTPVGGFELIIKDAQKTREKKAKQWSASLAQEGVEIRPLIQHQRKSLVFDILDVAKRNKVGLIALASRSGPVAQALLGGVARDVLLQAKCPVLIFHRAKMNRKQMGAKKRSAQVDKQDRQTGTLSLVQHA